MKEAPLDLLLKQSLLDYELLSNYRPISNLMFTSSLCKRVVATQVNSHLRENRLLESFQSAYKVGHNTKSALLRVKNDVLGSIGDCMSVVVLMLDFSAAFDAVDHQTLLHRLCNHFGIQGAACRWLTSYLGEREKFVSIGNERSSSRPLTYRVPQGSVLGTLLYTIYTVPLGDIMRHYEVSYHQYADVLCVQDF